jgi:hypothetical protein
MKKKKEEILEEKVEETKKIEVPEFYLLGVTETLEEVAEKFDLDINNLKELNNTVIGGNQIRLK